MDGRYTRYCEDIARRVLDEDGHAGGTDGERDRGEVLAPGHTRCASCRAYLSQAFTVERNGKRYCWTCAAR